MLRELIDIYMPDAKFFCNSAGEAFCRVGDYGSVTRKALKEMYHPAVSIL